MACEYSGDTTKMLQLSATPRTSHTDLSGKRRQWSCPAAWPMSAASLAGPRVAASTHSDSPGTRTTTDSSSQSQSRDPGQKLWRLPPNPQLKSAVTIIPSVSGKAPAMRLNPRPRLAGVIVPLLARRSAALTQLSGIPPVKLLKSKSLWRR
eukprot:scaffold106042_cov42-Prasinocladus_malaysianus.AAC.2